MYRKQEVFDFLVSLNTIAGSNELSVEDKIKYIVNQTVEELTKRLGTNCEIITVRERSGYKKTILKTIYSSDPDVEKYFQNRSQETVKITIKSFMQHDDYLSSNNEGTGVTKEILAEEDKMFRMNIYELNTVKDTRSTESESNFAIFPTRIRQFLETLSDIKNWGGKVEELSNKGACMVLGKSNMERGVSDESDNGLPIDQIVAIYTNSVPSVKLLREHSQLIRQYAYLMFYSIERAYSIDKEDFEREALRKITELIPVFSNREVSPADTVTLLIEGINEVYKKHPSIGPGIFLESSATKGTPWIKYVNVQFTVVDTCFQKPIFSIYPKVSADENPVGAYIMTRDETTSVSKYLLFKALENQNDFKLAPRFIKLFQDVVVRPDSIYLDPDNEKVFGTILTEGDDGWEDLSVEASSIPNGTKTTAAFLLQAENDNKSIPFAVLAFESAYSDAFTEFDINLLGRIVKACTLLLINMKLGDITIDYSKALKESMSDLHTERIGKFSYGIIMYELLRLDRDAALKILEEKEATTIEQKYGKDVLVPKASVRSEIKDLLQKMPLIKEEKGKRLHWLYNNYLEIRASWERNIDEIHKFLAAIPSNEIWHCYLSSLPRALKERKFNNNTQPAFTMYGAGFSALAMFIIDTSSEIQQIVKLAEVRKIRKEKKLYHDYVRYRIPLAARVPLHSCAFESAGKAGEKQQSEEGYGVLVSDLIGRKGQPESFIRLSIQCSLDPARNNIAPEDIEKGIKHHFEKNVELWKHHHFVEDLQTYQKELKQTAGIDNTHTLIQYVTKVYQGSDNPTTHDKLKEIIIRNSFVHCDKETILVFFKELISGYKYVNTHKNFDDINNSNSLFEAIDILCSRIEIGSGEHTDALTNFRALPGVCRAIIHGDMNGHNLTWAADYKRFFLIDFEHVKLGFCGVDQLKLIASFICESPREVLIHKNSRKLSMRKLVNSQEDLDKWHCSIMQLIKAICKLRDNIASFDTLKEANENLRNEFIEGDNTINFQISMMFTILETIPSEGSSIDNPNSKQFWRYLLRCLFFKQFQYALNDLDSESIKNITEIMGRIKKEEKTTLFDFIKLETNDHHNAVSLMYSFLALLASLDNIG